MRREGVVGRGRELGWLLGLPVLVATALPSRQLKQLIVLHMNSLIGGINSSATFK